MTRPSGGPCPRGDHPGSHGSVTAEPVSAESRSSAPDSRVDVALPEDLPIADLYPEILRLSGQAPRRTRPVGYHLVRRDGSRARRHPLPRLPSASSTANCCPSAVLRVAAARRPRRRGPTPSPPPCAATAPAGTTASCGAPASGLGPARCWCGFVLWFGRPAVTTCTDSPGILAAVTGVLLLALACVRARVYDDRGSAVALGIGALAHAADRRLRTAAPGHRTGHRQAPVPARLRRRPGLRGAPDHRRPRR